MINSILMLCILIECWHIFFFGVFATDKFKRPHKIVGWACSFSNMRKYFIEFAEKYVDDDNKELREALKGDERCISNILNELKNMDKSPTTKILCLMTKKEFYSYVMTITVEIIYWIFVLILLFALPPIGSVSIIFIMILPVLQRLFNKNNDVALHIFDSLLCIAIYIMIGSLY